MEMILAKMGEVVLKGLNRRSFEDRMLKSLRRRLKNVGNFKVYAFQSTVYVEPQDESADVDRAYDIAKKIFGIVTVARAYDCKKDLDDIAAVAEEKLGPVLARASTFKVETKRADKKFPLKSPEVSRDIGAAMLSAFPNLSVDVKNPSLVLYVEIRDYAAYVYTSPEPGAGGLPIGSAGKAAVLLSGGIDSPVAAFMMAKRGIELEAIHFYSYPYTSERAKQKVIKLAELLTAYCGRIVLHVVPFTAIQEAIRDHCPEDYSTIMMRRCMMRISEQISLARGCEALITGESLGQVASQTLQAMAVTEEPVSIPVLRPLVGLDKEEIVTVARKIDTFETSILPYEDCCTVFTPKRPKTKPKLDDLIEIERGAPFGDLEAEALSNCERLVISYEQDS